MCQVLKCPLAQFFSTFEDEFCKATLKDNVITVTVSENTTTEERYSAITIKGKNAAGKEISNNIQISQAAGTGTEETTTVTQKAFCGKWRLVNDDKYIISTLIINKDLSYEEKSFCIEDHTAGFDSYKKGDPVGNKRFGKYDLAEADSWTELPKEYLENSLLPEGYDKAYYVIYREIDRKFADRKYGKWLRDEQYTTMNGYFWISSDYKYMVDNGKYLWVKMDESDPNYPEPQLNYADPAHIDVEDSVLYESNISTEPDRMKYDRFYVEEDMKFLTDIQVTPDESFLHVESITEKGVVYYSFDENTSLKKREGHFNVQGTWPDGSIGKAVVTLRQDGGRSLENIKEISFHGWGKAKKTVVTKDKKEGDTTETDENSGLSLSLSTKSCTAKTAGSSLMIELSESQGKKATFTLSEGFKKSSKANDIVYSQDYEYGTSEYKGSMKASNVPCTYDNGNQMTITGKLSDGVTISDTSYQEYWQDPDPENASGVWYISKSYEYIEDSSNYVEIKISWNTDKWR